MNDNSKITAERQTKIRSSVKKYIAAGMTAAVFALCTVIGAAGAGEPETVDFETDIIPTETVAAQTEIADEPAEDIEVSETLTAQVAAFPSEKNISTDEDAVSTSADESTEIASDEVDSDIAETEAVTTSELLTQIPMILMKRYLMMRTRKLPQALLFPQRAQRQAFRQFPQSQAPSPIRLTRQR